MTFKLGDAVNLDGLNAKERQKLVIFTENLWSMCSTNIITYPIHLRCNNFASHIETIFKGNIFWIQFNTMLLS